MATRPRNWALYAAGAAGAGLVLYLVAPHVGPLILGILLAVLIDRPVSGMERRGIPRGLGALAVLGGGALAAVTAAGWVGAALYAEVRELAAVLPADQPAAAGAGPGPGAEAAWIEPLPPFLRALAEQTLQAAYNAAGQWVAGVVRTATRLPSLLWPLTVTLLVAYFVSRDRHLFTAAGLRYAPQAARRRAARLRSRLLLQVAAFLHAQMLVVGLSAAVSSIALFLLGSPYALSLGLLAGILDLIPFLGPVAVFGALAAVRALQGGAAEALAAAVSGLVVFGARQAVEPRLVAGRTQLHPLTVVVAVYLGSRLLGPTGFLLGPVIALVAKAFLLEWDPASFQA